MQLSSGTLCYISLISLILMFVFNCIICGNNVTRMRAIQQPGYRQPIIKGSDQITADYLNQAAQRNMCFINLLLIAFTLVPILSMLLLTK
jgi:hypothetical protein